LKSFIKQLLLDFLYVTGLLLVAVRLRLHGRATVLMYHRVLPADRAARSCSAPSIVVSPETFDWQMKLVRKLLRPVTGQEFARLLASGQPIPSRTCLVTFDDGWYDNLEFAAPVLAKHSVPAVLFVATDFMGTQGGFWQERLACLLLAVRSRDESGAILEQLGLATIRDLPIRDAREAIRCFVERIKLRPRSEIDAIMQRLESLKPAIVECGEDRFLAWNEVRQLVANGLLQIGSHAVSHTPLTLLSLADAEGELIRSRETIQEQLGSRAILVAYPNGNANTDIGATARNAGYEAGFTTVRGIVTRASDPLLLPRVNVHQAATGSHGGFLARVAGLM
jgi:peptidoglycan/xylan/chitin deacetylase (PgdA/CDA1 family)